MPSICLGYGYFPYSIYLSHLVNYTPFVGILGRIYELVMYCIFGAMATLVNTGFYWLFYAVLGISNVLSNLLAWLITLVFAFFTNKIFVYRSKGWNIRQIFKESAGFFVCRLISGLFDVAFMYVTVDLLSWRPIWMKLISALIVGIINYFGGRVFIFRSKKNGDDQVITQSPHNWHPLP